MYVGSRKPTLKRVLVLVIDDNDLIPEHTFEDDGEVFEIVCKLWKFPPSEGDYVFGLKDDIKIPETTLIKLEGCLKEVSKKLFENHSNLEILSVSAHRSRKNGGEVELELCIVLYCSCKGIIPYNEAEFPTQIQGVKTDVREGFFYLFPNDSFFKKASDTLNPLMIGANIGRKDQMTEGTLGGFVNFNNGEMGFITCVHVLFDMSKTNASQTNTSQTSFDVVQPSCTHEVCGVHVRSVFPNPHQSITVDAALIRLTREAPQRGLFSELRADDLSEVGFSMKRLPEYSTGEIRDYSNGQYHVERVNTCMKCGAGNGLTRGLLRLNGLAARWRDPTKPPPQSVCRYSSQLDISGTLEKPFAVKGDSGAFVYQIDPPSDLEGDDKLYCIGMVVGGTSYGSAVVTPIKPVLEALNASMRAFPPEEME